MSPICLLWLKMTSFYEGECLWKITSSKTLFSSNHYHLLVEKHSSVINNRLETREQTVSLFGFLPLCTEDFHSRHPHQCVV